MTLNAFDFVSAAVQKFIDDDAYLDSFCIVRIKTWFDDEEEDDQVFWNEVCWVRRGEDGLEYMWANDWWSGQQNVIVSGIYWLQELDLQQKYLLRYHVEEEEKK